MTLTLEAAEDAVLGLINTTWKASGNPTAALTLLFDDVKGAKPGQATTTSMYPAGYGRAAFRTLTSDQTTIEVARRYETNALLTVQIFAPIGSGGRLVKTYAQPILDALRGYVGSASSLWFFGVTLNEIGAEGPWFRGDVIANVRFQEAITA